MTGPRCRDETGQKTSGAQRGFHSKGTCLNCTFAVWECAFPTSYPDQLLMETSILELLFPSIASCQWRPSGDLPNSFRVGLSVGQAVRHRTGLLFFFAHSRKSRLSHEKDKKRGGRRRNWQIQNVVAPVHERLLGCSGRAGCYRGLAT